MDAPWDVILVGAGLANGLIAFRLQQLLPDKKILLIDRCCNEITSHTWSFHHDDLNEKELNWIAPLIKYRWSGYDVVFPDMKRGMDKEYLCITSEHFYSVLNEHEINILRDTYVKKIMPNHVILEDDKILYASVIIDGRGWQSNDDLITGNQVFFGQEWELSSPHNITRPILMDASLDQDDSFHFIYVLPFSNSRLLIEDTRYKNRTGDDKVASRSIIANYAKNKGWQLKELVREEAGCLPILLGGNIEAFWRKKNRQPNSGLGAALFHHTTGYSLLHAVRLADIISQLPILRSDYVFDCVKMYACKIWREQCFFRLLNRFLFFAGAPQLRWKIMQRFYRLSPELIARFYAGKLTISDKVRLLVGNPPVSIGAAVKSIFMRLPEKGNE